MQSLVTGERALLIENGADARYVPTGHLVFTRLGTLMAVPFDLETLSLTGGPRALFEGVAQVVNATNLEVDTGAAHLSISESGTLAYVPGSIQEDSQHRLRQVDRSGHVEILPFEPGSYYQPRFSPDGQRLVTGFLGMTQDLWVYDLARGGRTRLGTEGSNAVPLWTPDGTRVTFTASTGGPINLYGQVADGSQPPDRLTTSASAQWPGSWSPDGRVLTFLQARERTGFDIWELAVGGADGPQILSRGPESETHPDFSPDGRWLAYASWGSDGPDVYVKTYPPTEERFRVSTDGGYAPAWSPDGEQIFYVSRCTGSACGSYDQLMVADVETTPTFSASIPRPVAGAQLFSGTPTRSWDISPDGQRFLTVQLEERENLVPLARINLVLNWFEELKGRVPTN